jgi:DNA polymerase elongation subunit (family B)
MFQRSLENSCETEFLALSRNKGEFCGTRDYKTGKIGIKESTIVIASGQHDLHYIDMTGRLQVDLYNYLRRDFNLTSYKLDYCAGYFIGDGVKKIEHLPSGNTKITSSNLMGLENGNYIHFEESSHSTDMYKEGEKFKVLNVNPEERSFEIEGREMPDMTKSVRWGLAKDDVTPQDIFRMTNEGPKERAIIAKYCIQDCNLVHHLMKKIDVMTGYIEMSKICSVPISFLVLRGQSIKLTSFIAKKCREKRTLMPVIERSFGNESYEGAICLPPKCNLYLDNPVACLDYSSLYPSSMISENLSHDSKVWTKEFDLAGQLVRETGVKDPSGNYIYDNLPGYEYVDVTYDTYKWVPNGRGKAVKTLNGKKICRFAQPRDGVKAIMPDVLEELLAARKATRKLAEATEDPFMANILDKRQLGYKVTANSLYGQCGAKTSTFYDVDIAASTTATGRKLLTYGKRVVEEVYGDAKMESKKFGFVNTKAEYIYGDTDSVFFTFNLATPDGTPIRGKDALEITIEFAKEVGHLATRFLKQPHAWVYEKTLMPFCLLSKKRYIGMLYEDKPEKPKRKSMGIVLKRRDNAPIVKDIYGGVIDILMKEQNVETAIQFLKSSLQNLVDEKVPMDKLIISKSLRSGYKNPAQIAHKVLADRMGKRDPGNKPSNGDRIPFVYIQNPDKKALQGDRIETPDYILANKIKPNYAFYITNQIMKPIQQVFALVLENIPSYKRHVPTLRRSIESWNDKLLDGEDEEKIKKKITDLRNKEVKKILFDDYLIEIDNASKKNQSIMNFFKKK